MDREGPGLLRYLRTRSGLTQEDLADRAGIHVRTVRGLESGRIVRPHRSSVERIAQALALQAGDHVRLQLAWGVMPQTPTTWRRPPHVAPEVRQERGVVVEDRLADAAARLRKLAIDEQVFIDDDRTARSRATHEVLVCAAASTRTHCVFYDPMDDTIDIHRLHLTELQDCEVVEEIVDPDSGSKLFVLDLGRELHVGESHVIRYSADFRAARTAVDPDWAARGSEIVGFVSPPASCVLEVYFRPDDLPQECTRIQQHRPSAPYRTVDILALTGSHSVHLALSGPSPGGHGVAWRWPARTSAGVSSPQ